MGIYFLPRIGVTYFRGSSNINMQQVKMCFQLNILSLVTANFLNASGKYVSSSFATETLSLLQNIRVKFSPLLPHFFYKISPDSFERRNFSAATIWRKCRIRGPAENGQTRSNFPGTMCGKRPSRNSVKSRNAVRRFL